MEETDKIDPAQSVDALRNFFLHREGSAPKLPVGRAISAITNLTENLQAAHAEVEALHAERDALLYHLSECSKQLGSVMVFQDWPADAVLGDCGMQAIEDLQEARGCVDGTLSNYTAAEVLQARRRYEAVLKARRDELRARLAAKRAAAVHPPQVCEG